jgi:hypothetical protein
MYSLASGRILKFLVFLCIYPTFIDYQQACDLRITEIGHILENLIPTKLVQFVEVTMENTMSCVKIEANWGLLPDEAMLESRIYAFSCSF